jgi:predicted tellurium resistance membrane protein TerC
MPGVLCIPYHRVGEALPATVGGVGRGWIIILALALALGLLVTSASTFRRNGWRWKAGSLLLLILAFLTFVGTVLFAAPI